MIPNYAEIFIDFLKEQEIYDEFSIKLYPIYKDITTYASIAKPFTLVTGAFIWKEEEYSKWEEINRS